MHTVRESVRSICAKKGREGKSEMRENKTFGED